MNNSDISSAFDVSSLPSYSSSSSSSSSLDSGGSWLDSIKGLSAMTWIIIVLLLAFFGMNIFVYLAKGTQDITNFFGPLILKITQLFGGVTSQIVDVSAEGAKGVVNTTADVLDTGLTKVQDVTTLASQSVKNTIPQPDLMQATALNKALNTSKQSNQSESGYEADESSSKIKNKSGWCYIGEDRGFRSCAKVGENDDCMSGDIFPTHEICVNPNLRA